MTALLSTILVTSIAGFTPAEVRDAASEVLADASLQRELPGEAANASDLAVDPQPPPPRRRRPSRTASDVSSAVLWVLVAVFVGVLLLWLVSQFQSFERALPNSRDEEASMAVQWAGAAPLADADALARAGRFDEAVHALLLRALAVLRASRHGGLPDSLTSREVLRDVPLGSQAQSALGGLIETVETSLFGGRPVGRGDYDRCAEHFRTFSAARSSGTAA